MLIGLPGSGKSTWAQENKDKYDVLYSYDVYAKRHSHSFPEYKTIDHILNKIANDLLKGKSVCYDSTNINYKKRKEVIDFIRQRGIKCEIIGISFTTNIDTCIIRDKNREDHTVGSTIIRVYSRMYQKPILEEGFNSIIVINNSIVDNIILS